jgi:predicted Rdx family selenoprotein
MLDAQRDLPHDARREQIESITRRIADLNEQSLGQLSQYIGYLKWQEELWQSLLDDAIEPGPNQALLWQYDFLEGFPSARVVSTRRPDMMEIMVGPATCGMVQQPALWEHPPVAGSAVCEYQVRPPTDVDSLKLQFAVGIRDGALMEGENLCAFRIMVNGVRIWSTTKQSTAWERYVIDLPNLAGQELVVQFVTDALGDNRWNWAVWAEPQLLGYGQRRNRA